jgi:hypothetical protein
MAENQDSATGAPEPISSEVARLAAERDRLRAEVGDLRAQVPAASPRPAGRPRRVATALLVALTSIVFTVAVVGAWAHRNVLNTDKWVEDVGPIVEDPAVQQTLGNWMTTELMGAIDPEAFFESVLPQRGQALAAPLTSAVEGFVDDQVNDFLASDTFERLWVEVNRRAHARVVDVLEGDTGNLQVENGEVVLNLVPVLNGVLAQIGEASPEIFGRTVDLPTVTVDDIPEDAVAKVESALGRDLPDDFGQFTVFDAQRLEAAQDAVSLFDRFVVAAAILAVVLIALTLGVSPYRRRTLLQLAFGIALGVVLLRRIGIRLEDEVVDLAKPENQEAVRGRRGRVRRQPARRHRLDPRLRGRRRRRRAAHRSLQLGPGVAASHRVARPCAVGSREIRGHPATRRSHGGMGHRPPRVAPARRDRRWHRRAPRGRPVMARHPAARSRHRRLRARRGPHRRADTQRRQTRPHGAIDPPLTPSHPHTASRRDHRRANHPDRTMLRPPDQITPASNVGSEERRVVPCSARSLLSPPGTLGDVAKRRRSPTSRRPARRPSALGGDSPHPPFHDRPETPGAGRSPTGQLNGPSSGWDTPEETTMSKNGRVT